MKRAVLAAGCAVGFLGASRGVGSRSGLSGLDEPVWRFFTEGSNGPLEAVARAVTILGSSAVLLALAALAGIVLWFAHRSLPLVVAPWVAVQASTILIGAAKAYFDVERPPVEFHVVRTLSPAFPSGHAGNTAAFAVVTVMVLGAVHPGRRARTAALTSGTALTGAVAWSRLELNVHWFSDVVGGTLLGVAVGALVAEACLRLRAPDSRGDARDR